MAEGRDPVEVLAEDFIQRRRGGEDVSIEGYAQEHPELATQIRELFPALLFMETQSGEDEDDAIGSPPPEQFGSYRILEEIGHGGMGRVYLALDSKLDRQIALKLLPEKFSDDAMRAAMFGREAKTAAHLNHPNIATVHEMGEVDRRHFIAMEYVAGRSLGELLLGREPLSLEDLLPIAIQIAEGLGAAHKQNIIHRDLKPANIMLTEEGRVKILDFGLAKALGGEVGKLGSGGESLNTSEVIVGTPGYMSPEQARGGEVDARTDLFSLGIVLYEMATGLRAFHRASVAETLSALLTEDPPGVTAVNPKLPVGLERLIGKLLEKRAEDRPESAAVALGELKSLLPRKVPTSRRFLWVARGVAVLMIAGVSLVWLLAEEPWEEPRIDEVVRSLDARTDELSGKHLDDLEAQLAAGEIENAKESLKDIRRLDGDGGKAKDAEGKIVEAERQIGAVSGEKKQIGELIKSKEFVKSLARIKALRNQKFGKVVFKPAHEAADDLEKQLRQKLRDEALTAFRRGSQLELQSALKILKDLISEDEFELYKGTPKWLKTYQEVNRWIDEKNIGEARKEREKESFARLDFLPADFRSSAEKNLNHLDERIETLDTRLEFGQEIQELNRLVERRCLVEANKRFRELADAGTEELAKEKAELRRAIDGLEKEEEKKYLLIAVFDRYRAELKRLDTAAAKETFGELEKGWGDSLKGLNSALKIPPQTRELLLERAQLHLRLGEYKKADDDAAEALDLELTTQAYLLAGQAKFMQERIDEALLDFDNAVRTDETNPEALYWRGICRSHQIDEHGRQGTEVENSSILAAINDLTLSNGLGFESSFAQYNLAALYQRRGEFESGLDAGKGIFAAPFKEADVLANFEGIKGAWLLAKDIRCEAHYMLAQLYFSEEDSIAVVNECSKAIAVNDKYGRAYVTRGWAHLNLNELDKAQDDVNEALECAIHDDTLMDPALKLQIALERKRAGKKE